jgi:hypothetical protein
MSLDIQWSFASTNTRVIHVMSGLDLWGFKALVLIHGFRSVDYFKDVAVFRLLWPFNVLDIWSAGESAIANIRGKRGLVAR